MADVLGIRIKVPVIKEATSLGSFLCAATALGWFQNIREAVKKVVLWKDEYRPFVKNVKAYTKYYNLWRKVYPYTLSIADKGLLPSMWRAPGT